MSDYETQLLKKRAEERRRAKGGYALGVADERARVVAWLKDKSSEKRRNDWYTRMCAGEEIQRGEHEEAT